MSSRIEQLIDEIEEYIEGCKPKFMSSTEIIVNKDEIDELLRELRMKTPDEIKRYQKIISNKEAILNNVKSAAMQYMDDMLAHLENIISSSTQQASANYDALIGNLNQYRDIIQSNRSELHPVDEDLDDVDTAADAEDNLDVM